jgi:organic hydroperoxide reductase OsmC/OhrA
MAEPTAYHVTLTWTSGYQFLAAFEDLEDRIPLLLDEPPPLGDGHGPSAATLLAAAAGHCLAASLLFCLRKSRTEVTALSARVTVALAPGDGGRLHVERLAVELSPHVEGADAAQLARCQQIFEEFCVITHSLRQGIPVEVTVQPQSRSAA